MANLKLDIIYYKTSTDFELEFNLNGCCRMRIFKDKIDTQKEFVNALARDVARSKIIIIVTDLFGENSGVPTLAKAIGLPLTVPDKNAYGIETDQEIHIPYTAVPLVTKTGIYGGCIIESGPQSIIVISGVRALRHEIMKAYVHNYIFDVAQLSAYRERMQNGENIPTSVVTPLTAPTAPITESTVQSNASETVDASVTDEKLPSDENQPKVSVDVDVSVPKAIQPSTDTVSDDEQSAEQDTVSSDLEAAIEAKLKKDESEKIVKTTKRFVQLGISSVENLDFDKSELDELYKKSRKKRKGINIVLLIIVILLLIGCGVLAYFGIYVPLNGGESIFGEGVVHL